MIPFEMVEPQSLQEAVSLLDPEEPTIRAVAGGTALMLMMKAGVFQPTRLICLHGIEPEHARITVADDALRIGAMATLSDVEHDPNVAARLPVLKRAMRTLSNVRVRNVRCWRCSMPAFRSSDLKAIASCRSKRYTPAITKPSWKRTS
jgi:carbon-monoxide dehydrogenase medium subunit